LLLLLLFFLCFLIATAPASLLQLATDKFVPNIRLQQVTGTVWDGAAGTAVVVVDGGAINLGKLSWHIKPLSLLSLQPQLHIETDAGSYGFTTDLRVLLLERQLQANTLRGNFPLALLEPWVPLLVRGTIELDIERLVVDQHKLIDARGQVFARQLDWMAGAQPMPLGTYTARVAVDEGDLLIDLADDQAQLGIQGQLMISPAGGYELQAELSMMDSLAPEVRQAVSYLGRKSAQGNILLDSKGRWR
jgi:general secretion pathway protein N